MTSAANYDYSTTLPAIDIDNAPENAVVVAATYKDPHTGALYVHEDLSERAAPWAEEEHIPPPSAREQFGNVESFADYVVRFSSPTEAPFVTWNSAGISATLDYHHRDGTAGRRLWHASHPFVRSLEWQAWTALANGHALAQGKAVEFLEDHSADVLDPPAADLLNILRALRATVNKSASTAMREDGGTSVSWNDDKGISARGGTTDLPSQFTIAIPVLKGHIDEEGKAVVYSLRVRLRASVDDQAHLALRFSIPLAERTLETVILERVDAAATQLGHSIDVLRAAD